MATLIGCQNGWVVLLSDGRSYKGAGDVSDMVWWAMKAVRFEMGDLDPYGTNIRHLTHDAPLFSRLRESEREIGS